MQDIAILIAVSILSPVNIHIFNPAYLKQKIVSSTLSCNLSSIPVIPKIVKSVSN